MDKTNLDELCRFIRQLRLAAEELKTNAEGFTAVRVNVDRILANVAMLEMNVSEVKDIM